MLINEKTNALVKLRDMWREKYDLMYPGDKVQIGDFTYGLPIIRTWGEDAKLKIGKFCSIGMDVRIYLGGNHHNDWCTTYPFNALLPDIWGYLDDGIAATKGDVIIGNDVWIADNVMIMSGVTIGDGVTIAAGSVVTKDVLPYTIVGGVPARTRRVKLEALRLEVEGIKWWDWPLEKIARAVPFLLDNDTEWLIGFHDLYEGDQ